MYISGKGKLLYFVENFVHFVEKMGQMLRN